ncbi:hypothetical protein JEQ21_00855 [Streptococcus sp. 121]|uniref:hypothetical protein n=1 Tax=Streptococcus sp. 121 TaxID=2797637 RepID=UPI0018F07C73|nr:hypothetical protein [Streptococcus sp. 121]MBJ6745018.1 hypothetical protein [Streptococcus sp. 121]
MKANVFYRIKLKELEATTLKNLPRYEVDDTEEIREEKKEQLWDLIDILEQLEKAIKEDPSEDFKESARLRLMDDVHRHLLDVSFTRLDLDGDRQDLANRFLRLNVHLADEFSEILYGYELVADLSWDLDQWLDEKFFDNFFRMDEEFIAILSGIYEVYEESQRNRKSRMEIKELIGIISTYKNHIDNCMRFLLEVGKMVDEGKLKEKRMSYDFSEFQEFLDSLVDDYGLLDEYVW